MNNSISYQRCFCKSKELIKTFEEINQICNKVDDLSHHFFIDEDYHDFSSTPCAYIALYKETVVGFLCPYVIDSYNMEFCLLVLPEYRRNHLGSQLFFHMVQDFPEHTYTISLIPENKGGKSFLERIGFSYGCRECSMALLRNSFHPISSKMELDVSKEDDCIHVIGILSDIEIGELSFSISNTTVCIHDVEVYEKFRRQGYGTQFLSAVLSDIFEKYETVILHVTKENLPAYQLYNKLNFQVLEELDYYEL
ncbi:MAG: GNAT family N-acetyltransferase [Eubacterium sp.]|nr:GNAT family N-acetyltransferase [Eubacterium sp.]